LFLNTGHGTLGWTLACASAKIIADIATNRETDIDISAFRENRF
jgi:D-amino-acid dehydrogenase